MPHLVVALLATQLWSGPAVAGDADPLIDQVIAAYGGREALTGVQRYEVSGDIVASARGLRGSFHRLVEADGDLATRMVYPGYTEGRLLVEGQGWRLVGEDFEPVHGPLLSAVQLQWARLQLPLVLDAHRDQASLGPPRVLDGVSYPSVSVPTGSGSTLTVWVDPQTWLARASQGTMRVAGQEMTFSAMYDDYRPVDGIMVAHLEQTYAQGTPTATLVVTQVRWDPATEPVTAPPQ